MKNFLLKQIISLFLRELPLVKVTLFCSSSKGELIHYPVVGVFTNNNIMLNMLLPHSIVYFLRLKHKYLNFRLRDLRERVSVTFYIQERQG